MATWNLYGKGGKLVGTASGITKQEVEALAREQLGINVTAEVISDIHRPLCNPPSGGTKHELPGR